MTAAYLHGWPPRCGGRTTPQAPRTGEAPIGASDVVRALPAASRSCEPMDGPWKQGVRRLGAITGNVAALLRASARQPVLAR